MCSALLPVPKWRLGRRVSEREKAALTGDGARNVAVTYEELLQLARRLQGQTLETVTGRKFSVGLYRGAPIFTPASSGSGRSDGPKAARRFVERYAVTGSLRPGDYADITRNASYFIGMLLAARKPR